MGGELDRVLAFLRPCAKTALLRLLRQYHEEEDLEQQVVAAPASDAVELREAVRSARFAELGMRPYIGEALVRGAAANHRYDDFSQAAQK